MKQWLIRNRKRIAAVFIQAAKAGYLAWRKGAAPGLLLALSLGLAGCTYTSTTVREYDSSGRVVRETVIDGDVESIAAQGHAESAKSLTQQVEHMKNKIEVPILLQRADGTIQQVGSIKHESFDSGIAASVAKALDATGYDSQGVKMVRAGADLIGQAVPYVAIGVVAGDRDGGTGNDNSLNYDSSFNDASQSPQTVDNIAANVSGSSSDSHAVSTSTETSTQLIPEAGE